MAEAEPENSFALVTEPGADEAGERSRGERAPAATLHACFEAQAARTPHAAAVEHAGGSLTYRELDARADALARRLADAGAEPEARIGVCLERGPELVAAFLGVLKSGAAFVPLDPAYPAERLAYLVRDAGLAAVVSTDALRGRLPAEVSIVRADETDDAGGGRVDPTVHPQNAAYVVHTSGSTGAPKGVVVSHAAVVNHALAMAAEYGLDAGDRVLQFASPSFDVALEEVFPTLLRGATLVIREERAMTSLAAFLAFAREKQLTVWNLPSPYWHELVGEMERSGAAPSAHLRLLVVGSEAASAAALRG